MRLFEYQAKEIFYQSGISTPRGIVCRQAEDVLGALTELGGQGVLKAQVLTMDQLHGCPLAMASAVVGMNIEGIAKGSPQ